MNPDLERLQPYPFEKLRELLADLTPPPGLAPINLSIGEPKHPTPEFIKRRAMPSASGARRLSADAGIPMLREAIADWLQAALRAPQPSIRRRRCCR